MPELLVLDFDGVDEAMYAKVNAALGLDPATGAGAWPSGLISHVTGVTDSGHGYVVEVWEPSRHRRSSRPPGSARPWRPETSPPCRTWPGRGRSGTTPRARRRRSKLSQGKQAVAVDGVRVHQARFAEPELLQDPSRRGIPVPDPCPQPLVARVAHPGDHGPTCLSCVAAAMSRTQQLKGQLRLVGRSFPMKDQPAIPDDVGCALPLHRQDPRPRLLTLCAYLGGDVLHGRSAIGIYLPRGRHPRIPLSPQLAKDGGLVHSAMPKNKSVGLHSVQDAHWRHAGIVPAAAAALLDLASSADAQHVTSSRRDLQIGRTVRVVEKRARQAEGVHPLHYALVGSGDADSGTRITAA